MLERSECTQPGTLETFPQSLLPNWNFHNLSRTLDTELWSESQGNMLRSQGQDKEISTWRARASLLSHPTLWCSSIWNKDKQTNGRARLLCPEVNLKCVVCLDSGSGFWIRECWNGIVFEGEEGGWLLTGAWLIFYISCSEPAAGRRDEMRGREPLGECWPARRW